MIGRAWQALSVSFPFMTVLSDKQRMAYACAGEGTTALANRLKKKKTAEERAADAERRRQLQV